MTRANILMTVARVSVDRRRSGAGRDGPRHHVLQYRVFRYLCPGWRSLQGTQISGVLFSRRTAPSREHAGHRPACSIEGPMSIACRTPEICVPSFWQHHFTRRAEHARISPAPAALRHRRFERRHWQRSCPACCAARICSESSTPVRCMELDLVLTGCAHRVQRSLRQRVGIAICGGNDAWRVYVRWH